MQKRKIKNYYKYILVNYFIILIFVIISCEEENQAYKVNENTRPVGKYKKTIKIKNNLFCEIYKNLELESLELFLTDSTNFRIFAMSYRYEYGQFYDIVVDSSKVSFFCKYYEDKPVTTEKASEYTFEELKTKNNLRKGK